MDTLDSARTRRLILSTEPEERLFWRALRYGEDLKYTPRSKKDTWGVRKPGEGVAEKGRKGGKS